MEKIMSTISKELSTVLLVSSADFTKLSVEKQNEIVQAAGKKAIKFVPDLATIRNRRRLIERLLLGEDVSAELEYNEIELSDEEKTILSSISPILERIRKPSGPYVWLDLTETQENAIKRLTFGASSLRRDGYSITIKQGKKLWEHASAYWMGGKPPRRYSGSFSGHYSRGVSFGSRESGTITIGCQTVNRYELEAAAQHYGWDAVIPTEIEETVTA
jgi:hypothetical protein